MAAWFRANKSRIGDAFFYGALSIELLLMMFGHSAFPIPYRGRMTHAAFILFGCKTLLTKYTKREWAVILLFGIIGTISYLSVGDEWVIRIVMMIVSSKDISLERVIRYVFWVSLVGMGLIVLLSLVGIGGQVTDVRDYGRGTIEARWCLGFNHANNVHGTAWYVISLGLLAYVQKTKWYHYALLTAGNLGLYMLTLSRTGLIVAQLVVIAAFVCRYIPKITAFRFVYLFGALVTLFCAGIGIYTVSLGNYADHAGPFLKRLSQMLTGRLEMLTWYEKTEYWTLWGNVRERVPIDVGYVNLVADYGYVILACYVLVTLSMIWFYCRKQALLSFTVLMTTVFYTFMESTYTINVYLLCNFTFLLLFGTWNHLFMRCDNESIQPKI